MLEAIGFLILFYVLMNRSVALFGGSVWALLVALRLIDRD